MGTLRRFLLCFSKLVGAPTEEHTTEIDFPKLEGVLNYSIQNKQLFQQALSHRSYLQISTSGYALSNERLEFLGDSVLNLVVGEYLFHREPHAQEGTLTKARSRLVNRKALCIFARDTQLGNFILLSPNATQLPGRAIETILSDAFEAIVGALYLDGGYEQARKLIEQCLTSAIERGDIALEDENFKSQLLEQSQASSLGIPRYVTVKVSGPDHDHTFTVEVFIGNQSHGIGTGKNKKDAEQAAAQKALVSFNKKENEE